MWFYHSTAQRIAGPQPGVVTSNSYCQVINRPKPQRGHFIFQALIFRGFCLLVSGRLPGSRLPSWKKNSVFLCINDYTESGGGWANKIWCRDSFPTFFEAIAWKTEPKKKTPPPRCNQSFCHINRFAILTTKSTRITPTWLNLSDIMGKSYKLQGNFAKNSRVAAKLTPTQTSPVGKSRVNHVGIAPAEDAASSGSHGLTTASTRKSVGWK